MLVYTCEAAKGAHPRTKQSCKFSLVFIPLFSVGTKYLDSCTVCGRIIEVSKQQAETAALHVGRICGNSDLPSGREVVSTESYLLSPAVDRI